MTVVRLVIEGKPCPKNNKHRAHYHLVRGLGRHLSEEYKSFRSLVRAAWCQLRAKGAKPIEKDAPVRVAICAYWPTRRRVDVDAAVETTMDALTYAGVWDDDRQAISLLATKGYDKDRPRVEVTIEQVASGRR